MAATTVSLAITPARRAALEAERDRCTATIHAVDMADSPTWTELSQRTNARRRIHEIDEEIGVPNGPTDRQRLDQVRIALEGFLILLTTRGELVESFTDRISYDAEQVQAHIAHLQRLLAKGI